MKKLGYILKWLAAITLVTAHTLFALGGMNTMPLAFAVVEEGDINQKLLSSLGRLEERMGKLAAIETAVAKNAADYELVTKIVAEVQKSMLEVRKHQLESRSLRPARSGEVSEGCARFLGGLYLLAAVKQHKLQHISESHALDLVKEYTGIEQKASLSTSDIPIPTQWGGEVVELVSQYGAARKWGTVFPLGAGVVKLPQLGTDTTFGLVSASASVTAKSPTIVFVTFTPEKYGGLITLPSELDEDSIVAMGQFLGRYCARQMARAEDQLFWAGNGTTHGDPEGLTISTITNSKVIQQASTKTKYTDATLANIRAIRGVVDAPVLGTGAYYMHPSFEQHLAGLNTAGDKPYIANGINGASLDGYPIRWVDVMPAYVTTAQVSKVFMLFGDASYQYLGVRKGLEIATSREAGFATDEILVRALSRFTIGLMAVGAIAGLETAAS
jgi:HK97 family phage major capsid protein